MKINLTFTIFIIFLFSSQIITIKLGEQRILRQTDQKQNTQLQGNHRRLIFKKILRGLGIIGGEPTGSSSGPLTLSSVDEDYELSSSMEWVLIANKYTPEQWMKYQERERIRNFRI